MRITALFILILFGTNLFAATGRVFVSNEHADSVSVIDSATNQVIETIPVGKRPRGVGVSPDGKEVYVAISGDNAIAIIDPVAMKVVRSFASGDDPEAFAVHTNGNLYISNEEDAKASVFDPASGTLIAEIEVGIEPEGVALSPDGKRAIVTSESTNMLHVILIPEHTIETNILVGARPRAATFSADSKIAYATSEISGEVKKIDIAGGKVLAKTSLGDGKAKPKDVLVSRDGQRLFVAGGRANQVFVLDAHDLQLIKAIAVGKRVWGLALSRDGKLLYSTDGVDHQVSVIDTETNSVVATIAVGKFPWGVAIDD